jgi:uncharacterized protein (TIGR03437 family)
LTVFVGDVKLPAGKHTGQITIMDAQLPGGQMVVQVTLNVATQAFSSLSANPISLSFAYDIGSSAPPPTQKLTISGPPNTPVAVLVFDGGCGWLSNGKAGNFAATTPLSLDISINSHPSVNLVPCNLVPGPYDGFIGITPWQGQGIIVPVHLQANAGINGTPNPLQFTFYSGDLTTQKQSLSVSSPVPTSFTVGTSQPGWPAVSSYSGVTPAIINVSVNSMGLAPATYTYPNAVTLFCNCSTVWTGVTVVITVKPVAPITAVPNALHFSVVSGDSAAHGQLVTLSANVTEPFSVTSGGSRWLSFSPINGTAPGQLGVSVSATGLSPGTYNDTIAIKGIGAAGSTTIPVTLTVTEDTRPSITAVVNGASFNPPIAPGTWVTILGKNLSTSTQQATSTWLPASLNGVNVQLSGVGGAYSLLVDYVSPTQINAFVPHEVSPMLFGATGGSTVTVTAPGGTVSYSVDCEAISPALFTYGTNNYVAAEFPDYVIVGTIPGTRAASSGSVISLYGTGFGQTNPPVSNVNGPVTAHQLALMPTVTVGGLPATVGWAGMVGIGLYQFNIEIPTMPGPGNYPVIIQISGTQSLAAMVPVR